MAERKRIYLCLAHMSEDGMRAIVLFRKERRDGTRWEGAK